MSENRQEPGIEAPEADVAEQHMPLDDDERPEAPVEADEADVVERNARARRWPDSVPDEVNEADAADQAISVRDDHQDEDDYR